MAQDLATVSHTEAARPATSVGRYRILDKLGAGGMGVVYRARDEAAGRTVALKQLLSSLAGRNRTLVEAMFEREYHTLARLKHPRVIEVYDYGKTEAGPYYTMELLDGDDLHGVAPLPYRQVCAHLRDVTSLLALLQAHRLVHRDVTPRNVRLTRDGRAKLIDFGALHAFGVASQVVGTPPCVAPESVHCMPLDHRTDLYSLGAVAYWALTGRHAYPARRLSELQGLWRTPPPPPSSLVPGIPPELDRLVLSLLQTDPLLRPTGAALVIDQLTAIGGLESEEREQQAGESYLLSTRMVGRDAELRWVEPRIARALAGDGAEAVLDGPAGIGRTRLLHELALLAQLKGMLVLKGDALASPQPFGLVTALALQLCSIDADLALDSAGPDAAVLAQLGPELAQKLGVKSAVGLAESERRVALLAALQRWFSNVVARRPLLIAVDNLQAVDDASAAFLASSSGELKGGGLLVLCTQRSHEPVAAAAAVRLLRKRAAHLRLGPLARDACNELVTSLFGDVPNAGRVARLLHRRSGGNPQHLLDLARLLVRKGIAKYVGGTWVLPLQVADDELPSSTDQLMKAMLAELTPAARRVAEALAIYGRPVPLEICLALHDSADERETHAALDALIAGQVLLLEGGQYRFAQDMLRDTLRGALDDTERKRHHRRSADALLAQGNAALQQRMQAASHLIMAGEETAGAGLVASSWPQISADDMSASLDELVQTLNAALVIYDKQGRSRAELCELLFPLVKLGFSSSDWRLALRHSERMLQLGVEITGLARAHELSRFLGNKLALLVALTHAAIRLRVARKHPASLDLKQALMSFCGAVPGALAGFLVCHDAEAIERSLVTLRPFGLFGPDDLPSVIHLFAKAQLLIAQGRDAEILRGHEANVARIARPRIRAQLGEANYRHIYAGMQLIVANILAGCFGDAALGVAKQVDDLLDNKGAGLHTDRVRLVYHAFRGEIEAVEYFRERVERLAMQGGSIWQIEMSLPSALLNMDCLTRDTIGARRTFEQLTRLAQDVPVMAVYADAAQAAYLALRGELPQAIALYERAVSRLPPRRCHWWLAIRAYFADSLNQNGEPERARQLLEDGLSQLEPGDDEFIVETLEARRQLALAEAGLGQHQRAVAMLDALLAAHGRADNPLFVGLLHKARAELAIALRDKLEFEARFADMESRFRRTRNPALLAQCDRLHDRAVSAGLREANQGAPGLTPGDAAITELRTLAEIEAASDPFEYALRLVLQRVRARSGYLYLADAGTARLVAASSRDEPEPRLDALVREQVARAHFDAGEEITAISVTMHARADSDGGGTAAFEVEEKTQIVEAPAVTEPEDDGPQILVLRIRDARRWVVVGAMIVDAPAEHRARLTPELLEVIAEALLSRASAITR